MRTGYSTTATWGERSTAPSGYEAMLAAADAGIRLPSPRSSENDAVLMLYTAGVQRPARPARCCHTGRSCTQGALLGSLQGIGADYVYLNCGPLFHVATLMTTLATFVAGGTNVFTPRVDAEELCRLIESERCTGAFIMPPTINQIVELNSDGQLRPAHAPDVRRQTRVDGDDHPRRLAVGPPPRRIRPDRGHGTRQLRRARAVGTAATAGRRRS